ncbi:MAG TPA: N-acetyltransferase [Dongiaceae bacterium]|jgi:putative acetyltransferase
MTTLVCIRVEQSGDVPHIRDIAAHAFGQRTEADLTDRLRADGDALISLVAVTDRGELVGHILFSRLKIDRGKGRITEAAALAPLAVRPEHQRQGIGSALIQAGITACSARGLAGIVVLGHPKLYRRFGFSAAAARSLRAPFSGDAFMALELRPGALVGVPGTARYADAFAALPAEEHS